MVGEVEIMKVSELNLDAYRQLSFDVDDA